MDNLWTKINDEIPTYMTELCQKHNLKCVKVSELKTAMVGRDFSILIAVDRFDIELYYLYKKGDKMIKHPCGSYFAQAYDSKDREHLLKGEGADIFVRNCILITEHGLASKWKDVLDGDKNWLDKYKSSSRYATEKLTSDEIDVLTDIFI
ncbi:hypothetical protein [Anaerosporobacter faecicola]|uniref:hypothetical protein n=1 Tax=Anaerosporobacter faecicola TaxID=2718714 RepID=UPI001438EC6B|nr:hypothetical protein [Anaerosporobacter faecicola]